METIKYIDTGVNWLGKIPSTWESKRIKMLTRVKRGASPRPIDNPIYFDEEGEFAWVRIADVTASERYLENTTQRLSELGSSLSVKRYPDDFFLSIAGTVGKPIITKIKCCIHDGFVYFPDLKINPEFLYYIFSTGLPYLGLGKLGTQLNLNTDTVGDIYIPIPDEKEIEKIVGYLDEKTFEIDSLISKKQKLIECLIEEKQTIINQAVTKGIQPNFEMKKSGIEWFGSIPKHWNVKKLKYVKSDRPNSFVDGPFGSNLKSIHFVADGDVYVVESGFVTSGEFITKKFKTITQDHFETIKRSACKEGDIVISKIGANYGMSAILPLLDKEAVVSGNSLKLTVSDKYLNKFVHYCLLNLKRLGAFEVIVNSTAQPALSLGLLNEIPIATPDIEEQIKIVEYIENENSKIESLILKVENEIELIKEYRTSLINEVVTGKITLN